MPELPEVETVRRGLEPHLAGRRLAEVIQRRPDLRWPLPERFAERLTGRAVLRLGRRSKYLLIDLDCNETWIVHLGMSGRILVTPPPRPSPVKGEGAQRAGDGAMLGQFRHEVGAVDAHDHVIVTTDQGVRIVYNDARRFGAMDLWPTDRIEAHPQITNLGPEPLGNAFHADHLAAAFKGKKAPAKSALLDQKIVAGLGNIYACEALYRAGIHPRRLAGTISRARVERLTTEIVATLQEAITAGGSSLRDYRQADGELGYFQHSFKVYDREGEACARAGCSGRVARIVQSGRSSFYCTRCQR